MRKLKRECARLERMSILDQNATMTKQSPSLTTSLLAMGSGNLVHLSPSFKSVFCFFVFFLGVRFYAFCANLRFQVNVGRGAKAQSGNFWGPWTVLQGPGLQRWICWKKRAARTRLCSDVAVTENPEWAAVRQKIPESDATTIRAPTHQR